MLSWPFDPNDARKSHHSPISLRASSVSAAHFKTDPSVGNLHSAARSLPRSMI